MPAIGYTKTATVDGAWDAGANVKRLAASKSALRACHAWVDPDGDADAKSSYKFPHHEVDANGKVGAANTRACSAIIAALNGGRGGTKIPDADRKGVYAHAAGHLKAAGKDVPELKSLEQLDAEARGGEMERRFQRGTVELRDDGDADAQPKLRGYAAVFNEETMIGGAQWGFREQIAPGAFADAIQTDDVRALFNHDDNQVLGRTKSGTLRLVEDDTGLKYEIDPPDTVVGRDVVNLVSRGDIDGSSFAFRVIEDQWEYPQAKSPNVPAPRPLRTVLKVELYDVSPVTYPAYPQTSVSARAKEQAMANSAKPAAGEPDPARRDGNGATGNGDSGDVGGDVGGMEATAAAIAKAMRRLKRTRMAVRGMQKALDISHGFNDGESTGSGLAGPGGAAPRKKLTKAERKAFRKEMRALYRDSAADNLARERAGVMYQAARGMRDALGAANRSMRQIRMMCRAAGINLPTDKPATGGKKPAESKGDGTVLGAEANQQSLEDLDLRAKELEVERLR